MKVEINACHLDELNLGFHMANGNDDYGDFRMLSIGFLIMEINFIKYH